MTNTYNKNNIFVDDRPVKTKKAPRLGSLFFVPVFLCGTLLRYGTRKKFAQRYIFFPKSRLTLSNI